MKRVPVAKATPENIWSLERIAQWHREALEYIHPNNKTKKDEIPRHKQILSDLETEILTYYETHDPIHKAQMAAANG